MRDNKWTVAGFSALVAACCGLATSSANPLELEDPCQDLLRPAAATYPPGCTVPSAPQISVLGANQTWINGNWTRNREPATFVRFFDGSLHTTNSRGLQTWWYTPDTSNTSQPVDNQRFGYKENPDLTVVQGDGYPSSRLVLRTEPGPDPTPGAFDGLLWELRARYADGWRRIVLYLPSGVVSAGGGSTAPIVQSANQWGSMAQWKRDYFSNTNGAWRQFVNDHPLLTIEIYMGSSAGNGVCTPCTASNNITGNRPQLALNPDGIFNWYEPCSGLAVPLPFDPRERIHMDQMYSQLKPWRDAGVTRFWMDETSPNTTQNNLVKRWGFLELAYQPQMRAEGMTFGGESTPVFVPISGGPEILDPCSLEWAPWFSRAELIHKQPNVPGDQVPNYSVNRNVTEFVIAPGNVTSYTFREYGLMRNYGFVLASLRSGSRMDEVAKRWYSMGWIFVPDFNADGRVNDQDMTDFTFAMNNPLVFPKVFGSGDIDGDGVYEFGSNGHDIVSFTTLFNNHRAQFGVDSAVPPRTSTTIPVGWANYGLADQK